MKKYIYTLVSIFCLGAGAHAQNHISNVNNYVIHNNSTGDGLIIKDDYVLTGVVKTQRSENSNEIVFDENSSWNITNKNSYIDGMVRSKIKGKFLFPLGHKTIFSPLGLSNSINSKVAYYDDKNDLETNLDDDINQVNEKGYWEVSAANISKVTLYYAENTLLGLTDMNDLNHITIAGWNGEKWERIPSSLDSNMLEVLNSSMEFTDVVSTLKSGSITSVEDIVLGQYTKFTFGRLKDGVLNSSIISKGVTTLNYTLLKSVHFPFNDKNLTQYSTNILNNLSTRIQGNNSIIKLIGHTDYYGSSAYNYKFGMERAEVIKAFLERNGVSNIEIEIQSEGEDNPKVDCENCSSKEMVLNRRVDIYISK